MTNILSSFFPLSLLSKCAYGGIPEREREICHPRPAALETSKIEKAKELACPHLVHSKALPGIFLDGHGQQSDAWPFLMCWVLGLRFSCLLDGPVDVITGPGARHLQALALFGYLTSFCTGWVRPCGPPTSSGLCLRTTLAPSFTAEIRLSPSSSSWQPRIPQGM